MVEETIRVDSAAGVHLTYDSILREQEKRDERSCGRGRYSKVFQNEELNDAEKQELTTAVDKLVVKNRSQ